jgi:uncharacterized membrane protein
MAVGPVEYIVIAFPGNEFKGEIAPALEALVKDGIIDIIDFAFVYKDAAGDVAILELEQEGGAIFEAFEALSANRGGIISEDDLRKVAEALEPNSSAMMCVWEDVWAARFADAALNAGGIVVDLQRIPAAAVEAALAWQANPTV